MTHAVFSILVMFLCLAHAMEDVNSPQAIPIKELFPLPCEANLQDDVWKVIEALDIKLKFAKANFYMNRENHAEQLTQQSLVADDIQNRKPDAANKKMAEAIKKTVSKLEAEWVLMIEENETFWESIQREIDAIKVLFETTRIKTEL